jgi:hypothetical protein
MFLKFPYGIHEKSTKMKVASIQLITSHRKTGPIMNTNPDIRPEDPTAVVAKMFLGYQLCQLGKNHSQGSSLSISNIGDFQQTNIADSPR